MDPQLRLDFLEDRGEKALEDITVYQAVVGSHMHGALATQPDISYSVAALSHYNSRPFISYMTTANGVLQSLKSTANFDYTSPGIALEVRLTAAWDSASIWA